MSFEQPTIEKNPHRLKGIWEVSGKRETTTKLAFDRIDFFDRYVIPVGQNQENPEIVIEQCSCFGICTEDVRIFKKTEAAKKMDEERQKKLEHQKKDAARFESEISTFQKTGHIPSMKKD